MSEQTPSAGSIASTPVTAVLGAKSPAMLVVFLVFWGGLLLAYGPRLAALVAGAATIPSAIILGSFVSMVLLFWLLACYHLAVVLFAWLAAPPRLPEAASGEIRPAVAILYPTCNDFQPSAVLTCLAQDYPDFHVYILDDSSDDDFRRTVDRFSSDFPRRITVVRRPDRSGFKAGNLNYALRHAAAREPYFVVVDADEHLPRNFLSRTVGYIEAGDAAFIQANHRPNPAQPSPFARDIAPTILPFWDVYCRPRVRFGFVLYLGHGALVRRRAWEAVGGFPETILEDLAFSATLATAGLRGVFVPDLVCEEDFPATFRAFKRQHERYVIGVTQVWRRFLVPLLRSPRQRWFEKLDFVLWCSPLYVPALCLLFAALSAVGLPAVCGVWRQATVVLFGHSLTLPPALFIDDRFAQLWTLDFQLICLVSTLSPALACLALGLQGRLRAGRLLLLSTAPYMSLMVVSWRGILSHLFLGTTFSPPTGETVEARRQGIAPRAAARAGWGSPTWAELILATVGVAAAVLTFNPGVCGLAFCLFAGIATERLGWESRAVRVAAGCCFVTIGFQLILSLSFAAAMPGLAPLVFTVHF